VDYSVVSVFCKQEQKVLINLWFAIRILYAIILNNMNNAY
jgi:hypothetical protein